jgi:hypothetical protein
MVRIEADGSKQTIVVGAAYSMIVRSYKSVLSLPNPCAKISTFNWQEV